MQFDFSQIQYSATQQNQPAKYQKAICFCVDEGYLPYALFVAKQILEIESDLSFDLCICLPDLSQVPNDFLQLKIRFVEIDISGFDNLPVGHLSLAAYHRLFLPHIFSDEYEYIFYVDADTYVLRPFTSYVDSVINQLPEDFCVGASADIVEVQIRVRSDNKLKKIMSYIGYYHQKNHIYRNSGVLLINVKNYINTNCLERIFTYAFDESSDLKCHDQSALNGALLDELAILPFKLNWQMHKLNFDFIDEFQPYIIHFIGENKPWSLDNPITKPYQLDYQKHLNHCFPELANRVEKVVDKRFDKPKYENRIRESISLNLGKFKVFLKDKSHSVGKVKHIEKTRATLVQHPFTIE